MSTTASLVRLRINFLRIDVHWILRSWRLTTSIIRLRIIGLLPLAHHVAQENVGVDVGNVLLLLVATTVVSLWILLFLLMILLLLVS